MTKEQEREAIRLLRIVVASTMGRTDFGIDAGEWIGWPADEMPEGVHSLKRDARALLDALPDMNSSGIK